MGPYAFFQVTNPRNVLFSNLAQPASTATGRGDCVSYLARYHSSIRNHHEELLRKISTFRKKRFSFLRDKQVSFKFESLDMNVFILWFLKLFCGLRATGTSLNITYKDPKQFGRELLPSHPYFKLLGCLVLVSAMSSASDIFCANFDLSTCSVLELNLIKRLDEVVFNDSRSTDTPMVLASRTVFAEEFQFCWILRESVVSRAVEGHPFLPHFFEFFRDCCGFSFGNVETVEDCILELARSFYPNTGIEDWSEYSQDSVNLVLTKLRREIGASALAAKLNKPLGSAVDNIGNS
jgi:hypothetical protein